MLQGITVLDLSTVGPAARAGRWLAERKVIKETKKEKKKRR